MQLKIPIASNPQLRMQLTKLSTKYLRIGRLLEVLDGLVGIVAYRYCYADILNSRTLTVATLGVYNFLFFKHEFENECDMNLNTYVTYVGNTSIEINCDLYQNDQLAATVQFMMVARSAQDYTKSVRVPQLAEEHYVDIREICKLRNQLGLINHQHRIAEPKQQLDGPNLEESKLLHKLMLSQRKGKSINSTILSKHTLMHTQDRNLHGKAFGGNIMKEIIELGWLVGYSHANGGEVYVIHIFDVTFLAPVPIGSKIAYTSKLCYVEDSVMIIQVQVDVHQFENQIESYSKTTEVYLAMKAECPIDEVLPVSYQEATYYMYGHRLMARLK